MVFSNEAELIAKLRSGDNRAVEVWYEQSRVKLFGFFKSRVREARDVDELVHDTYLSCLSSLPLFRGQSSLFSWMIGIARHELADYWRKRYAKRVIQALPLGEFLLDSLTTTEPKEESSIQNQELQELFGNFPEEMIELLQMKYVDGLSVQELALQFGISFSAMQSRLHRAKELFKAQYESLAGE